MLIGEQDPRAIQQIQILILRTREQYAGTGIFYHVPLRSDALVPENPIIDYEKMRYVEAGLAESLGRIGLRSKQGSTFSKVPKGYRLAQVYGILGTADQNDHFMNVATIGDEVASINMNGRTVMMEILDEDLMYIQEQNQMALNLKATGFLHFNTQYYGEGFDPDGRDRNILQGSIWCTPLDWAIKLSRPAQRSSAANAKEVEDIAERALIKQTNRAVESRSQKLAQRAERDDRRAAGPMPPRRGTNTQVSVYGGPYHGRGTEGVPYGENASSGIIQL
jgi:hypothetical protein